MSVQTFDQFALAETFKKALAEMGITEPTEIQAKAIPLLLTQKHIDFHGQAQTGTGKTLAFGLPLLQNINQNSSNPQALIVAPTRELVLQICESLTKAARYTSISIVPIYGGVSIERQIRDLRHGAQIIVGTPGRLNDHLRRKTLVLKDLVTLVLDEADIMLDMGFRQEIDEIMHFTPKNRNIWLFSATVKQGIEDIKNEHMTDPIVVRSSKQQTTTSNTKQYYCMVPGKLRLTALCRFIDQADDFYGVIFCQTKVLASEVAETLSKRGYSVSALHGDMDQNLRNAVIAKFRAKEFKILVATDVAARGIDVSGLTHVVNYSLPEDQESYVHRIGRTGRAGKEGTAITFIGRSEMRRMQQLARRFSADIKPLEVPGIEQIVESRTQQAALYLATLTEEREIMAMDSVEVLKTAIKQLDEGQLATACTRLLVEKFLKGYEREQDINFGTTADLARSSSSGDDKQEIMLHIGSEDGVTRQDIVHYCKIDGLDQRAIERIRVINKRSFIVVPARVAPSLVEQLKERKLLGKKVRVTTIAGDPDASHNRSSERRDSNAYLGRSRDFSPRNRSDRDRERRRY